MTHDSVTSIEGNIGLT